MFCCKCGKKATGRRQINEVSKQCSDCAETSSEEVGQDVMESGMEIDNSKDYWENMNRLLDSKFSSFEQSFKETILGEVKQITDPISSEVVALKKENTQLKTELTLLKAQGKEHTDKLDKVEKTLREHQKTLLRNDKNSRSKRLILAGVSEEELQIDEAILTEDREKVDHIIKLLNSNVDVVSARRIGKKDQGAEKRPRFLLLEFKSASDRNAVKKNSSVLKDKESTKSFYVKADLSKKTREEYGRLYEAKKKILEDDPSKTVKIDYGKLYVNDVLIDQIEDDNQDFL